MVQCKKMKDLRVGDRFKLSLGINESVMIRGEFNRVSGCYKAFEYDVTNNCYYSEFSPQRDVYVDF